jgi:hypothetical protein
MAKLTTRIGTGEDCAMAGFSAVRYFSLPERWQIVGFIGRTADGFQCRWQQDRVKLATVGDAESWIQARSGHSIG